MFISDYKMLRFAVLLFLVFPNSQSTERVVFVGVIYRHGDRTPVNPYPTDPYKNESLWPVRFGELTNVGKRQHFALGQWLRNQYSELISEDFDPKEAVVLASDADRTIMSADVNLAGFYPPSKTSSWNPNLSWQPIPVHTKPQREDELVAMKRKCDAYDKEMTVYKHSEEYKKKLDEQAFLMTYLSAYTGTNVKSFDDIEYVYSTLKIEEENNFTLPSWTGKVYPDGMKDAACYSFRLPAIVPSLARYTTGPLLKDVLHKMNKTIDNEEDALKLAMYSGHDITVANLLQGLGMFDGNCPAFTATVLMELTYDNTTKSHFVRIYYRNFTDIAEPYLLSIPHCGQRCPYSRFTTLYENLWSVNWEQECYDKIFDYSSLMIIVAAITCIIVLAAHKTNFNVLTCRRERDLYVYAGIIDNNMAHTILLPSKA